MVKIVALIYASIETFIRADAALRGNFGRKAGYASRRCNSNCNPPQRDHFPLRQAYINTRVRAMQADAINVNSLKIRRNPRKKFRCRSAL